MARVTVEDCISKVPNRFELIMYAAHRARRLNMGEDPTVPRRTDKPPVVALREIAGGTLHPEALKESLITNLTQRPSIIPVDEEVADSVAEDVALFSTPDPDEDEDADSIGDGLGEDGDDDISPEDVEAAVAAELDN